METKSIEFQQACALHHQGRTAEAAEAYERILQVAPSHLDTLIHLGVLRLAQGQAEPAEQLLRRAVSVSPDSPEALGNLAAALQALGRHEEAATLYERALNCRPDMLDARFGLAGSLQACGRHEAAVACYEAILVVDPAHPEANYGLGSLLARLGRDNEAIAKYRTALASDPDFAEASHGLGKLLARGDTPGEGIDCFRHALDVDPDYIEARMALGTLLSRFDRDDEAMAAFRAVVAADPDHAGAHNGIGLVLARKQSHAEAIGHFRTVLARTAKQVDAMAGLASSMKNIGQHNEALAIARQVVALRPNFAPAADLLGSILAELGSMDEAEAEFRRAVALAPGHPPPLYHLALLATVEPDDGTIDALEVALRRSAARPSREQCLLQFALAKAYEDVGQRDRSFEHLLRGNAIKRSQTVYDEASALASLDHLCRVFTAQLLASRQGLGDPSNAPVFIVGMPRSGTTLVEQTLASHRAVFGAGERLELSHAVTRLNAERHGAAPYPEALWTTTAGQLRQMGSAYVAALRSLAPDASRITDKMPLNFLHLGLIHLILPNARIIHTVRDPVDTCLSCFSKLFTGELPFAYELGELGRFHRAYQGMMAHWRAVLPSDTLLEVHYEATVSDFEGQARRIVAHCGLEWDPACLEFYKTSRPVHTASMTQVRQPIYSSSVGRWRPDELLLRPLLNALGANA
jgi:tetratricopeptide (TPR) repeat protein